jgi:hypothetical protein
VARTHLTPAEERNRCYRLVHAYRDKVENSVVELTKKRGGALDIDGHMVPVECVTSILMRVVKSLYHIEDKIKNHKKPETGDFTLEELNSAIAMMEQLDRNPFD